MKKLIPLILLVLAAPALAEVHMARYGEARTFNFKLYNADGTLDTDESDGGSEVSVSCNEGDETTATNDFVDEGTFYSIALTAAEMTCARVTVVVAATVTEVFHIETYGHPSSQHPTLGGDSLGTAETTIDSVTSQLIFSVAAGSSDNDAYNNWGLLIIDASSAAQRDFVPIDDYAGGTLTVTLRRAPVFTVQSGDRVIFVPAQIASGVNVTTIKGVDADTVIGELSTFNPATDKVNIGEVNDVTICGVGAGGDPWGPCP
jgi:hypothetical protein